MGLPLAAGHVLVRLGEGPQEAAEAVLDALEAVFPTHTGRGLTRIGNVWEDPPTVTSEGVRAVAEPRITRSPPAPAPGPSVRLSESFDARSFGAESYEAESYEAHRAGVPEPPVTLAGALAAELLGGPEDVRRVARALAGLCRTQEEDREERGPQLVVRLRLEPRG
ncbi:hypothetical protein [Kitasatospora sp. NPDC018619]|uniref:hypothetical protein n=1 Tax=unclassified Kitasatospora TaxID=2633591 RepID=UPI0037B2272B